MSFFNKLKEGLKKTRENMGRKFFEAFKAKELDGNFYDELEMAMISSDMGVTATEQVLEELKSTLPKKKNNQAC